MPQARFFLDAFTRLSTCRDGGMGPGPIPWSEVDRYALRFGLSERLYSLFERAIALLDSLWLEHAAAQAKAPRKEE